MHRHAVLVYSFNFFSTLATHYYKTPCYKFSYLGALLLEPAWSAIGWFALTSTNYKSAIELLQKRYGKKITIQSSLVNKLLNTCPIFNECDASRLWSLYDFAETKYRVLQALGVDEKNYSKVVFLTLLEKIPDSICLTITQGRVFGVDIGRHAGGILSQSRTERGSLSDAAPRWIQRRKKRPLYLQCLVYQKGRW